MLAYGESVHYKEHVEQLGAQYRALRAAAVHAGPYARVPTCPDWGIPDLLGHLGRVYAWIPLLIGADSPPARPEAPKRWGELVPWTDTQMDGLTHTLADTDPDTRTWFGAADIEVTMAFWARRMANETAIHRLDAEHAMIGDTEPILEPLFDPGLAADGIDELLGFLVPLSHQAKRELTAEGTLLVRATDADQAWEITLSAGHDPVCRSAGSAPRQADATMSGTADAVFRAIWNRPSTAVRTGHTDLFGSLPIP